MELTRTKSRTTDTLEVVKNGYKVVANVAVEQNLIKSLSGYVMKEGEVDEYGANSVSWSASKQNGKWGIRLEWAPADEQDIISDLATEAMLAVVAEYETAA